MSQESLQKLVTELDVLILARYPLIAANTHEEGRFRRVMGEQEGTCDKPTQSYLTGNICIADSYSSATSASARSR